MRFDFEGRGSESPFVESIWRTQSEAAGAFMSTAAINWEMVITTSRGMTTLTVRGPESKASPAYAPPDATFLGIVFRLGAFMPQLPVSAIVDGAIHLPETSARRVRLHGDSWELPDFENADVFVQRLAHQGLLVTEPAIETALLGQPAGLSLRSLQRRFVRATGLTHGTIVQIERARQAATLLAQGTSILDTVALAGYADQPHLTRSVRRFIGLTPADLLRRKAALIPNYPVKQPDESG